MNSIIEYLKEMRGIDFSGYRRSAIEGQIKERLRATGYDDYGSYLKSIRNNDKELDTLIDTMIVSVSRFFRNTLTFEYLASRILPHIVLQKIASHDQTLRVWSSGCATGEEPYSIAILLKEIIGEETSKLKIDIFASDIDKNGLKKAREGVYSFEKIRDVRHGILKKYFGVKGKSFRLIPEIVDSVIFTFFDIVGKKCYVPSECIFADFDLIVCRNVLIYFSVETQDRVFENLYRALSPGSYLVLGETERPTDRWRARFRRVTDCCRIYQKI